MRWMKPVQSFRAFIVREAADLGEALSHCLGPQFDFSDLSEVSDWEVSMDMRRDQHEKLSRMDA